MLRHRRATSFLFVGACFLVAASYFSYRDWQFYSEAQSTTGTVVGLTSRTARFRGVSRVTLPMVAFVDSRGNEVTFTSQSGSFPSSFSVGDEVGVAYAADNPENARVNEFSTRWLSIVISVCLGLIFGIIGLISRNGTRSNQSGS